MQDNVIKNEKEKGFVSLADLSANDVKKWHRFPVRLRKLISQRGITATVTLVLEKENLQLNLVSSEQLSGGRSRQLRFFQADAFVALVMSLNLPDLDKDGKTKTEWLYDAAVRFVKGSYKNSEKEYYAVEILFKQYKYHVHFLTPLQKDILENLAKNGKLKDFKDRKIDLVWEVRPEAIEESEQSDAEFAFN